MTAMTQPFPPFAYRHHHPAATAGLVVLFWLVAATLVALVHARIEPRSEVAGAVATVAALLATAFVYALLVAREAGVTHALGVGIAWLVLSIAAEMALTSYAGQTWFTLLGSPARPLLRNVLLFVWIFAPVLYARRQAGR